MLRQPLPSAATDYSRAQRLEIQAAVAAVNTEWSRMGPNFDLGWARIGDTVEGILLRAQTRLVRGAASYVPDVLEDTAQVALIAPEAAIDTTQLVGLTGAGYPVGYAAAFAPIKAKQAIAGGASILEALSTAGDWLEEAVGTILSDTGRSTEALGMYTRDVPGYVRMLSPPSCSRCVILAGAYYRMAEPFDRHPECDCRHIPAAEALAGDLTIDPRAYFDSLDEAGQVKFAGSIANRQAILDGANINQLVNAYRRSSGLYAAQSPLSRRYGLKFTTAGSTDRSWTAQQQVGLGLRTAQRGSSVRPRLMPESIYANAVDRDDALQMLRSNGWIVDLDARAAGRAALDAQVRKRRAASAEARRQRRREELRRAAGLAPAPLPDMDVLRETVRRSRERRRTR
ncbi:hypothetical protein QE370_000448 [Aeromicrobium sp. SORGH_AS981]|uniref:hypothetical protein n=1 Tax=Aeromicrobium sp. SORGH_AS_0981 TaxID=3041802 RepID=UPI002857A822|nr:hypothetical protein [Aeromicrobium sp. SORGH_AS_0981]MDR6117264.1 hypothetical protein [Aeromicrobium sp. SORGH_AS_0981]